MSRTSPPPSLSDLSSLHPTGPSRQWDPYPTPHPPVGHSSPASQAAATPRSGQGASVAGRAGGGGVDLPERRVRPPVHCLQQPEKAMTDRLHDPTRGLASSEKWTELP